MDTAFNDLANIVSMTTDPADQNTDNIQIISSFFSKAASILNQSSAEGNIEPAVIEMVSCFIYIVSICVLSSSPLICACCIYTFCEMIYLYIC